MALLRPCLTTLGVEVAESDPAVREVPGELAFGGLCSESPVPMWWAVDRRLVRQHPAPGQRLSLRSHCGPVGALTLQCAPRAGMRLNSRRARQRAGCSARASDSPSLTSGIVRCDFVPPSLSPVGATVCGIGGVGPPTMGWCPWHGAGQLPCCRVKAPSVTWEGSWL